MTAEGALPLLLEGYGWLPNRLRRSGGQPLHTRLMGQPAVAIGGPEAVRWFYDERHITRRGAVPELVQGTLFGRGGVQTLDGEHHRHRKAMFESVTVADPQLVERTAREWDAAARTWSGRQVVLFDEASRVLARSVLPWAGLPVPERELSGWADDLVAMVDGFATLGPRHWRARRARTRRERSVAALVQDVRRGEVAAPAGSVLEVVAEHRDGDGQVLPAHVAAVELLNVVRPTVAVCWFLTYAGHALHRWPQHRPALRAGDAGFATAFAQEVRRFYPFAPFVGGLAAGDVSWRGDHIPAGTMVLLDLYGQNHDPRLWPAPYEFRPDRFRDRAPGADDLVPQGGGDPHTGHRCPGEDLTVALLRTLAGRLASLEYQLPEQDLGIPLRRIPTRVRSGVVMAVQ